VTITFACPKCGREIRVRDEAAGKKGQCNSCKNPIVVPLTGELIARPPHAVAPRSRPAPPALPPDDFFDVPAPRARQQPEPLHGQPYQPPTEAEIAIVSNGCPGKKRGQF